MIPDQWNSISEISSRALLSERRRMRRDNGAPAATYGAVTVKPVISRRGFTLLETMIVVALIGIMAAIAVPSIRTWLPHYQLRSVTSDIVGILYQGKMRAVAAGHNVYVDFDHNGNGSVEEAVITSYLDTDDDGSRGSANNGRNENEFSESQVTFPARNGDMPVIELPGCISFGVAADTPALPSSAEIADGIEANNDRIEFHPSGRVTLNGDGTLPTIYLKSSKGEQRAIQVNMLGQITVYRWGGSDWEP